MITLRGVNEPECGSETRTTTATGGAGRLRASDTLRRNRELSSGCRCAGKDAGGAEAQTVGQ